VATTVVKLLAAGIYADQGFERLPILADTLKTLTGTATPC
jgi:hypothetical protein